MPDEVIVVWQADDVATRELANQIRSSVPYRLHIIHSAEVGVVPAENRALEAAQGEVILLVDDDATVPPDWVARHLSFYTDPEVGAVGGPAVNHQPDGTPFPKRAREPVGKITWFGRPLGNLHDHVPEWRLRSPLEADSLVGYNLSFRREAIDRFDVGLRPYWQFFELEACFQVKRRGFKVLVDFANVIDHHPTNPAYAPGRGGDLDVKVYNLAYNYSYILGKHSPWFLRPVRLLYLLMVGSVGAPGLAAFPVAIKRYGHPFRELGILARTWQHTLAGWREGSSARNQGG